MVVPVNPCLEVHKTADRRIVQADGIADFRETVTIIEVGSANGFVASRQVNPRLGSKELAYHWPKGYTKQHWSRTSKRNSGHPLQLEIVTIICDQGNLNMGLPLAV